MEENTFAVIAYKLLVQKKIIQDCFKINGKPRIKMPNKGEYVTFKSYVRKMKLSFMIYSDFESILVTVDN